MSKETMKEGKLSGDLIEDEYYAIQRAATALAVLRDGIREAGTEDELFAWQTIADMLLENEVFELDDVLKEISDKFEGLEYKPVEMSSYSLLRSSDCDCHKKLRSGYYGQ